MKKNQQKKTMFRACLPGIDDEAQRQLTRRFIVRDEAFLLAFYLLRLASDLTSNTKHPRYADLAVTARLARDLALASNLKQHRVKAARLCWRVRFILEDLNNGSAGNFWEACYATARIGGLVLLTTLAYLTRDPFLCFTAGASSNLAEFILVSVDEQDEEWTNNIRNILLCIESLTK